MENGEAPGLLGIRIRGCHFRVCRVGILPEHGPTCRSCRVAGATLLQKPFSRAALPGKPRNLLDMHKKSETT